MPTIDGFVITAFAMRAAFAFLAILLLVKVLPWIDKKNGISFKGDVLPSMRHAPLAIAHYYGLRFLACAVLIGLVVS